MCLSCNPAVGSYGREQCVIRGLSTRGAQTFSLALAENAASVRMMLRSDILFHIVIDVICIYIL